MERALVALVSFLTDRRLNLNQLQRHDEDAYFDQSNVAAGSTGPKNGRPHDDDDAQANSFRELGQIIDTTLLKAYLLTNNSTLVGALLRVPNQCHVAESVKMLLQYKKYGELVELYHGKDMHLDALQLLAKYGSLPNNALHGVGPTVAYLHRLNANYIELILEFSKWVIQADEAEGLRVCAEVFVDMCGLLNVV